MFILFKLLFVLVPLLGLLTTSQTLGKSPTYRLELTQRYLPEDRSCSGKIDLVVCIDASGSVNDDEWTQQADFVKGYVDVFSGNHADTTCDKPSGHAINAGDGCGDFEGENGLKISIMNFASGNIVNIGLSTDYQAIKLATLRTENGETNTHKCLLAAEDKLRDPSQGARNGAAKIILLLTDGTPTSDSDATAAANAAKAAGTLIIGVGVGTGHCYGKGVCTPTPLTPKGCCSGDDNTIMKMVSPPSSDYYIRIGGDFSDLKSKLQSITDLSCPRDCTGAWGDWSICSQTTGTRTRSYVVNTIAQDNGKPCPNDETENCDIDCEYTFSGQFVPTSCTVDTEQIQTVTITVPSKNNGQACPEDKKRDCTICKYDWSEWNECDSTTGRHTRSPIIAAQPVNGGTVCPNEEEQSCPVPCQYTWGDWSECDQQTGTRKRDPIVTVQPLNSGTACPPTESGPCDIDCEFTWGTWTPLSCTADTEATQPAIITMQPQQSGQVCPEDKKRDCTICKYDWSEWNECDLTTGRQTRSPIIAAQPVNGGTVCPNEEERGCAVPCQFTWGNWICNKNTGKKSRSPIITAQPFVGWNGVAGEACPIAEEEDCPADCEGSWLCWSKCSTLNYLLPSFTRKRDFEITITPRNGGLECPTRQTEACLPDVCYSAESSSPSFGTKIMGMVPFRTLPPNHPGFTRTDCGGPITDVSSWIPAVDTTTPATCTGPSLWYALDTSTGNTKNEMAKGKDGIGQLFFLQDSDGRLHFGMLIGAPSSTASSGYYSADYTLRFEVNKFGNYLPIGWEVQNDVPVVTTSMCNAKNGKDCYSYDTPSEKAKVTWNWKTMTNAGGVLGPLQAYDFCIKMSAGDVSGVDSYEFASDDSLLLGGSGNGYKRSITFNSEAFDYDLKICPYECKRTHECADIGDDVWDNTKSNVGGTGGGTGTGGTTSGTTTSGTGSSSTSSTAGTTSGSSGSSTGATGSGSSTDSGGSAGSGGSSSTGSGDSTTSTTTGTTSGSSSGSSTGSTGSGGSTTTSTAGTTSGGSGDSTTSTTGTTSGGSGDPTTSGSSSGSSTGSTGSGGSTTSGGEGSASGGEGTTTSGTSSGSGSGSGAGTSTTGSETSTGSGVIVTPATCSTGKVNAAGDGCAPTCSTGEVNTAGDACAPSCTTGAVNAAGDGCASSCTTGAVNAAGNGCTDPDATFDKPGTFETPGEYTPPGEFTHAKDADGNDVTNTGGDTNKDGNAAVLWGVIGGACFLLLVAALLLIQHRRKKPSSTSTKNLPKGWEMFVDPASGYPCYVDPKGDTHWDLPSATGGIEMQSLDFDSTHCENPMRKAKKNHHSRNSTQLPDGWDKDTTGEGDRFYIERESGLTTWDAPKGSTGGSTGVAVAMTGSNNELAIPIADGSSLPKGWTEHVTEDGDTMYYNEELDETRWDMPNS